MRTPVFIFLAFTILCCSSDYYSVEDFVEVRKVDTHMHLNGKHLTLAEQARTDNFQLLTVNVDVPDYPSHSKLEQSNYLAT
jgi:hypothetical protein